VGISVGLGVGVAVSLGLGDGDTSPPAGLAVGETGVGVAPGPRRWVVAIAARMTVPSPLSVARVANGLRSADGLGLSASGVALVSLTTVGDEWVTALGRCRAPKYTSAKAMTRTMRARLAATSVGANMDLIASHRPFLRMAPVPPCEPSSPGHSIHMATDKGGQE
jgi:hypothetical protein